ncbi:MAG TPA: GatB/YqeY domain-containing protein [Bacillota bacterium]|jgi:uncharacterized protein YqeY|nr:GatB/YqeY domain-containing protein [Bacillota bacterium]HOL10137.1 GatB/YqeY domain-containing protein [Bacillota bacterium]HPO97867.1 GatB/YqeY domain-containing protein [Bacillota bacterium]
MTLKEKLQEEMKVALKNKSQLKLSVIRLVKAAITNLEIDRGHELDDSEVIEVLAKEAKQRKDAIIEYEKAGRNDIVESLKMELQILQEYLPAQLSEEELKAIVQEIIDSVGATSKKDMGKVMAALMPKVKGRADGKVVNQLVNSFLE